MRKPSLANLIAAAFACACGVPAMAATINVPPVVVNTLTHQHFQNMFPSSQTITRDMVQFPCTAGACSGPGFSAAIGTGDTVVIRLQAPPGQRFRVIKSAVGSQFFTMWAHWQTTTSDALSNSVQPTVTFENLTGVEPTLSYNLTGVADNGNAILTERNYTVSADFTFTAIHIQFNVTHALPSVLRSYGPVNSYSSPSFGSARVVPGSGTPDATLMVIEEIVPVEEAVPPVVISKLTHSSSGGPFEFYTSDGALFPCTAGACSGPGFTGSFGSTDIVIVRFEAPAGKKFAVTFNTDWYQFLGATARWETATPESTGTATATAASFENLSGVQPPFSIQNCSMSANGQTLAVDAHFNIQADCSFTALQLEFQITHALPDVARVYNAVNYGGFGVRRVNTVYQPNDILMRILPICPGDATGNGAVNIDDLVAVITTWGAAGGNGDVNGDGLVNIDDLVAVVTGWGGCK